MYLDQSGHRQLHEHDIFQQRDPLIHLPCLCRMSLNILTSGFLAPTKLVLSADFIFSTEVDKTTLQIILTTQKEQEKHFLQWKIQGKGLLSVCEHLP